MKRFLLAFLLLRLLFIAFPMHGKILHLSFHRGCINNFQLIAELLNLEVVSQLVQDFSPKQFDGITSATNALYNIGYQRARNIWQRNKDYFNQFDAVVVSDTAPLARIFLQNNFQKPLIIWICNRFDYYDAASLDCSFPDTRYYHLMKQATRLSHVKIIGYTQFELTYGKSRGIDFGSQVITPLPYYRPLASFHSAIPANINKSETFFIPAYHNDSSCKVLAQCERLGIPAYQGRYNGPHDLHDFKGIIHIPYSWSNLALFENFYSGLVYFIPSITFLRQLASQYDFFIPNANFFFGDKWQESEWYNEKHQKLFVYFDSWEDLKNKISTTNYEHMRHTIYQFCIQETEAICNEWKTVFQSLNFLK